MIEKLNKFIQKKKFSFVRDINFKISFIDVGGPFHAVVDYYKRVRS